MMRTAVRAAKGTASGRRVHQPPDVAVSSSSSGAVGEGGVGVGVGVGAGVGAGGKTQQQRLLLLPPLLLLLLLLLAVMAAVMTATAATTLAAMMPASHHPRPAPHPAAAAGPNSLDPLLRTSLPASWNNCAWLRSTRASASPQAATTSRALPTCWWTFCSCTMRRRRGSGWRRRSRPAQGPRSGEGGAAVCQPRDPQQQQLALLLLLLLLSVVMIVVQPCAPAQAQLVA